MSNKPISLTVALVGVTALGWAVACSSSGSGGSSGSSTTGTTGTTGTSGGTGSSGSSVTGSSGSVDSGATSGTSSGSVDASANTVLIDNMTSVDGKIALGTGFAAGASGGYWYSFSDITATELNLLVPPNGHWSYTTVAPPAGVTSTHAACLTAPAWGGYAAGIGFNFAVVQSDADAGDAAPPAEPTTYDTTPFSGVTFYAMALPDAGAPPGIKIAFPDDQTHGADPNALCHRTDAGAGQCDDDYADQNEALGPTWALITISFANIVQGGYGGAVGTFPTWDAARVWGINIQVNGVMPLADGGVNNAPFGFCISDIQFTK